MDEAERDAIFKYIANLIAEFAREQAKVRRLEQENTTLKLIIELLMKIYSTN